MVSQSSCTNSTCDLCEPMTHTERDRERERERHTHTLTHTHTIHTHTDNPNGQVNNIILIQDTKFFVYANSHVL